MKRSISPLSVLGGLLALAAVGLLIYGVASKSSGNLDSKVNAGQAVLAPNAGLKLPTLLGKSEKNLQSYRGKVVLLNFWASWCEPCKAEAPALERAQSRMLKNNATVLGINYKDSEPDAAAFLKQTGLSYPNLRDIDAKLADSYNVNALPDSFLIDRQGRIVALRRGQIDDKWIDTELKKLGI